LTGRDAGSTPAASTTIFREAKNGAAPEPSGEGGRVLAFGPAGCGSASQPKAAEAHPPSPGFRLRCATARQDGATGAKKGRYWAFGPAGCGSASQP